MTFGLYAMLFLCMVACYTIYDYAYPVDHNLIWNNHALTIVLRLFLSLILGFLLMLGIMGAFVGIVSLSGLERKAIKFNDKEREELK